MIYHKFTNTMSSYNIWSRQPQPDDRNVLISYYILLLLIYYDWGFSALCILLFSKVKVIDYEMLVLNIHVSCTS